MEQTGNTLYDKFKEALHSHLQSLSKCLEESAKINEAQALTLLVENAKKDASALVAQADEMMRQFLSSAQTMQQTLERLKCNYSSLRDDYNLKEINLSNSEDQLSVMRNRLFKKEEDFTKCQAVLRESENRFTVISNEKSKLESTIASLKTQMKNLTLNFVYSQPNSKGEKNKLMHDQAKLNNELSRENNYVIEEVEQSLSNANDYYNNEEKLIKEIMTNNEAISKDSLQKGWDFINKQLSVQSSINDIINTRIGSGDAFQKKLSDAKYAELLNCCLLIVCDVIRANSHIFSSKSVYEKSPEKEIKMSSAMTHKQAALTLRNPSYISNAVPSPSHSKLVGKPYTALTSRKSSPHSNISVSSFNQLNKLAGKIKSNKQSINS